MLVDLAKQLGVTERVRMTTRKTMTGMQPSTGMPAGQHYPSRRVWRVAHSNTFNGSHSPKEPDSYPAGI